MYRNFFLLLIFILLSLIILMIDNFFRIGYIYFYTIVTYIIFSILKNKMIQLIDVWNISFVFIILSEVFIRDMATFNMVLAIKYLIIANNVINIGYLTKSNHITLKENSNLSVTRNTTKYNS